MDEKLCGLRLALPPAALLGFIVWLGRWARPMADDFCMAALVRTHGLVGAQSDYFIGWSGRYTGTLATTLAAWAGARALYPLLLALVLSWCVAAVVLIRSLPGGLLAVCLALGAVPALVQDLYWQDGMLYYLLPVAVDTSLLAILLRFAPSTGRTVLLGALAVAAAGCHESAVVLQCGLCMLVPLALPTWRRHLPALVTIGAATALGVVLDLAAPGNTIRASFYPPHAPLLWAANHAVGQTAQFTAHLVPLLLTAWLAGALFLPRLPRLLGSRILLVLFVAWAVAVATIAPCWYAEHQAAPDRNLLFPAVMLIGAALWAGRQFAPRRAVRPGLRVAASALITGACLLSAAPQLQAWSTQAPVYAARLHTIEAQTHPFIGRFTPIPTPGGFSPLTPGDWVAACARQSDSARDR